MLLALVLLFLAVTTHAAEVRVMAASLTDALQDIARQYEKTTRDKIIFSFGARTSSRGRSKPVHPPISFSADERSMDRVRTRASACSPINS